MRVLGTKLGGRALALVAVAAVLWVLVIPSASARQIPTGASPIPCPLALPSPTWTWRPGLFNVPLFMSATQSVPFFHSSLSQTVPQPSNLPFGNIWYTPSPTTTVHNGHMYVWEDAAVVYTCFQVLMQFPGYVAFYQRVQFLGFLRGSAVLAQEEEEECTEGDDDDDDGEYETVRGFSSNIRTGPGRANSCGTGGDQEEVACYDVFEWWFDNTGYHERYLYSFCEDGTVYEM